MTALTVSPGYDALPRGARAAVTNDGLIARTKAGRAAMRTVERATRSRLGGGR